MRVRGWCGPSFDAETALVDGEGSVARHFRLFARSLQMDTALKGTVGAMRGDIHRLENMILLQRNRLLHVFLPV
jgi:hypothetical protein